jgi:zinc transport system substrate-binding protein
MRIINTSLLFGIVLLMQLTGCGREQAQQQGITETAPYIVAVNNPLLYFARRLIGDDIEVRLLAPADTDPAAWQPAVADVLQLQGAELLLLNGAGYSSWLDKVAMSSGKLVVTTEAVKDRWIELSDTLTHSHGPGGEHAHGGYAFTTWMDMSLAQAQAQAVAAALQQRWPRRNDAIAANLTALSADIDSLDEGYRQQALRLAGRQLIYSHPVYQYFQRRYQLPGYSLHWEPGVMPTEQQWEALRQPLNDTALFIWEAEPAAPIRDRMASLGLEFVVLDPAANTSGKDWLAVQRENLVRLSVVGE